MKFRVLIKQDDDGMFVAEVPSLPGCWSQGDTLEEAVERAQESIKAYFDSLRTDDGASPRGDDGTVYVNV